MKRSLAFMILLFTMLLLPLTACNSSSQDDLDNGAETEEVLPDSPDEPVVDEEVPDESSDTPEAPSTE